MPYFALLLNDAKLEREHKRQQDRKSQFSISFPSFDSRCSRRTMSIGFWKFKHLHLLPQEDLLQNHFPLHKKQAGLTQNHSSYCMGILSENCLIQDSVVPKEIPTDQGTNITSKLLKDIQLARNSRCQDQSLSSTDRWPCGNIQ